MTASRISSVQKHDYSDTVSFQAKLSIFTGQTGEPSLKGEESPHRVLSCSSLHWRRKSDSGVPGIRVALWLHTASSAPGLQTAYWPAAPAETLDNAVGKQQGQGFIT